MLANLRRVGTELYFGTYCVTYAWSGSVDWRGALSGQAMVQTCTSFSTGNGERCARRSALTRHKERQTLRQINDRFKSQVGAMQHLPRSQFLFCLQPKTFADLGIPGEVAPCPDWPPESRQWWRSCGRLQPVGVLMRTTAPAGKADFRSRLGAIFRAFELLAPDLEFNSTYQWLAK